ncbi:DUF2089 domain-containing protein [Actinopolymorpha singaporensis]|uniref:DUF2089 domain-containing protein n=1 Tax=Actinopolymorpha singaporensis TaxID=117157 RepID=A0A1H1Z037_9ACTN|nr:DUF2089 domain-containing protein [Actinopolymorpha singaporensis]SDT26556.1 hypothetical protein SAMN04489717_5779 [Actinopolymorpha singaporensis]
MAYGTGGYPRHPSAHAHRPPRDCPVCGAGLQVTRLSCDACASELSGVFESCGFCGLTDAERDLLRVFLVSRGNMREVERHLGVSYPTARQRYADLLAKLGLEGAGSPPAPSAPAVPNEPEQSREDVLAMLARGEIDVDAAADRLRQVG